MPDLRFAMVVLGIYAYRVYIYMGIYGYMQFCIKQEKNLLSVVDNQWTAINPP